MNGNGRKIFFKRASFSRSCFKELNPASVIFEPLVNNWEIWKGQIGLQGTSQDEREVFQGNKSLDALSQIIQSNISNFTTALFKNEFFGLIGNAYSVKLKKISCKEASPWKPCLKKFSPVSVIFEHLVFQ